MAEAAGHGRPGRRTPIRLVAVDVDGTLLDGAHRVSPANAAAVRAARSRGVRVVLVTARPPIALRAVLAALDADAVAAPAPAAAGQHEGPVFVASQGALTGRFRGDALAVLARHPMPVAAARACAAAVPAGVCVQWYALDGWLVEHMDALVEQEARIVAATPQLGAFGTAPAPDKLLLLAPPERTDLLDDVHVPAGLEAVRSTPTHLEVTAAGVDKVAALAACAVRWGIGRDQVAAIGDGPNDAPMLAFAGVAIVPANASPQARAMADLVVPSNDQDAVARALELLLG
ncbi:MAG TPA: HAD hydrolase family protein [Candidatus Nanopelagicales bacterium]